MSRLVWSGAHLQRVRSGLGKGGGSAGWGRGVSGRYCKVRSAGVGYTE